MARLLLLLAVVATQALVGFAGTGRTWGASKSFSDADSASYMGVDLARGPEETAIYIQAGSAWR